MSKAKVPRLSFHRGNRGTSGRQRPRTFKKVSSQPGRVLPSSCITCFCIDNILKCPVIVLSLLFPFLIVA